jgi:hypothetical protein
VTALSRCLAPVHWAAPDSPSGERVKTALSRCLAPVHWAVPDSPLAPLGEGENRAEPLFGSRALGRTGQSPRPFGEGDNRAEPLFGSRALGRTGQSPRPFAERVKTALSRCRAKIRKNQC